MEIVMKDEGLNSFKDKDVYTWDEILGIIDDLEYENEVLKEKVNDLELEILRMRYPDSAEYM